MHEHKLLWVNIREVKGADYNPKQHDIGTLHQSMDRFGFIAPLIRNEASGKLVGGHGRIETLRQKFSFKEKAPKGIKVDDDGDWYVPVITGIEFETDAEADAYLIADNRLQYAKKVQEEKLNQLDIENANAWWLGIARIKRTYRKNKSRYRHFRWYWL